MLDTALIIIWFLIALFVLVAVHEFGHFYVARRCGVKVLRFSIGLGKPLLSTRDKLGTEYSLSAIPLGGYVKMLDEREGDVPEDERQYSFNSKSVWQRIAIAAAGPVANFILAVMVFWLLLLQGTRDFAPIVGEVEPGSIAAQAGLETGQEILAVDGVPTPTQRAVFKQLLQRLGETGSINFLVKYADSSLQYDSEAQLTSWLKGVEEPDPVKGLGLAFFYPATTTELAYIEPGSPADSIGLQVGDTLLSLDGQDIPSWEWLRDYVSARPGQILELIVKREGLNQSFAVEPESITQGRETIGRLGIIPKRDDWPESMIRETRYGLGGAFVAAVTKTWETTHFVLISLKKLVLGEISPKNLSGPVTIAKVASDSAKAGWTSYLGFLALLSVFLAVFNLLPIPVLDGGLILYGLVEAVKGSPLSDRVQMLGYQVGLVLIIGVMVIALYNDIMRL